MNGGDEVVAAPGGPPLALDWKFSQVFGERTAGEEVQEGNYLVLQEYQSGPFGSNWYSSLVFGILIRFRSSNFMRSHLGSRVISV